MSNHTQKSVKSQINTPKHTLKSSSTPARMLPEVALSPEGGALEGESSGSNFHAKNPTTKNRTRRIHTMVTTRAKKKGPNKRKEKPERIPTTEPNTTTTKIPASKATRPKQNLFSASAAGAHPLRFRIVDRLMFPHCVRKKHSAHHQRRRRRPPPDPQRGVPPPRGGASGSILVVCR